MRLYDLVVVFKTSLTEEKRKKLLESIKEMLKDVKVSKEESLGQKVLSYQIKHEQLGVFYRMALETDKTVPLDFEKRLINNESILRHLLVRTK